MKQYKVGDKVRVVKRIGNAYDYPFSYTDEMVEKFEGKIVTISDVKPNWCLMPYRKFFNNDSTVYKLEEDIRQFDWHSSMFEPVESDQHLSGPGRGSKITIGNFTGEISKNDHDRWYVFFGDPVKHAKICQTLHDNIDGFFKLAKAFGDSSHSIPSCFPSFESLESLLQFVEELNKRLADKASNSLKKGDSVYIGKIEGIIESIDSRYFVMFKADHCKTCTKLCELIPNFDSLAIEYGSICKTFFQDCFPVFPTLEKLLQFIAVINNKLNNPQKLQKNENRLQKPKASIVGGSVPEGRKISGRKDKTTISSRHLSYRVCDF